MSTRAICVLMVLWLACVAAHGAEIALQVHNPADAARGTAVVVAAAGLLGPGVTAGAFTGTLANGTTMPVQVDDVDADGTPDELVMVLDIEAGASVRVTVDTTAAWEGDSYAAACTKWRGQDYALLDSDRLSYRVYEFVPPEELMGALQWDCYGKRPEAWKLSLEAMESVNYHQDNPVAVDFLLVGDTFGLGALIVGDGRPVNGRTATFGHKVICNGPVRAGLQIDIADFTTPGGGRYEAFARYFIHAHSDFIEARVTVTPQVAVGEHFGVGVRKLEQPDRSFADAENGLIGVWGQQETIIGETGLALIFEPACFKRWGSRSGGENSDIAYLKPALDAGQSAEFRFRLVGVWEHGGIADVSTFRRHIEGLAGRFRQPVTVTHRD